ncbi:MAG: SDR family NAD(P)-dependent oxidoreductase [Sedimentitalea sp.]
MTGPAFVTGGSRGIGAAIVARLLADGRPVITCGRGARPETLDAAVHWITGDVADPSVAHTMVDAAQTRFGPLALLVNNAGVQVEKTIDSSTDDDWDLVMGVNARGVFNMCRAALPQLMQTKGSIVNIGSISGHVSDPQMALYNASKGFVHALTRSIAVDHGPDVRCNAVSPGWIMTEMAEDAFALAQDPARAKSDALARHPVGRFGAPDDIANAVAWLGSDQASYVTGQCLTVDGGMTSASPLQPGLF